MRYTLIVKGSAEIAMEAARQRGILHPEILKDNAGTTVLGCNEPDSKDLFRWFTEDTHMDPPFPLGSLLHYREG
jgi:hypothetical protein